MDQNFQRWFVQVGANPPDVSQVPEWSLADRIDMSQRWGCHQRQHQYYEAVGIIPSSPTILLVMSGCGECFKVAEHSFQVPMPNSPLLFNYLWFGVGLLQESRLTTEEFILAFWLGCMLLPGQQGWLKARLKKKIQSLDFFHRVPTMNWDEMPSVNTVLIKFWHSQFS